MLRDENWYVNKLQAFLYVGIKDLPNGLEDRAVKSWGKLKEEYKEEVMVEDVATLFHLGSEMAPENLPCKTGGKEAGGKRREEHRRLGIMLQPTERLLSSHNSAEDSSVSSLSSSL
ncbi:hypothetical protein KUCAC02_019668 [Chaenocephalus aceratus]|uniref:Uncharacterized protein n=1 Tax=Chaenocephalus aceratus TaxID=36190 RepID=A0ACB9VP16_CHAAC|nr:hypothetical protein KUCAC02_019668 [Chaenocephalus aceratus]